MGIGMTVNAKDAAWALGILGALEEGSSLMEATGIDALISAPMIEGRIIEAESDPEHSTHDTTGQSETHSNGFWGEPLDHHADIDL